MRTQIMTITPELAKSFLGNNTENRKKRGWWVTCLANMIKRGEWLLTHQGIAFTKSGKLIDGQHRLEAIVEAGMPVQMLVIYDVDDSAFKVVDSGVKRTLSDLTGMNVRTAEVCRILARLVYGGNSITTADQALTIYNCGVGEIHDNLVEFCGKNIAILSAATVRSAAVALIMDGYNQQTIKELYSNLCNQQFNDLPAIAHAFLRQVSERKVSAHDKSDLLARALKVLHPDYANTARLQISDSEATAANAYVRSVIRKALSKEGIVHEI